MNGSAPLLRSWRDVAVASLAIAVLAALAFALEVVLLIFTGVVVGVFLAQASINLSRWLRVPRWIALAGIIGVGAVAGFFFAVQIVPQVAEQLQLLVERLPEFLQGAWRRIENSWFGADAVQAIEDSVADAARDPGGSPLLQQGAGLVRQVAGIFSSTLGALTGILVVLIIALYIGAEPSLYRNGILALVPPDNREDADELLDRLGRVLAWWFAGQTLSMLALGSLMTAGLSLLGVPFALVFGIFTALMTFIPNLGPVIAAIPVLLVALTQGIDVMLYATILVIAVQNVEGLVLTPLVHRRFIALPPALVLGALLILGTLAGFIGVLVAMPLTAVALTVTRFIVEKRDIAAGAAPPTDRS